MSTVENVIKPEVAAMEMTGISKIAVPNMSDSDIIPLWFGEGDIPTAPFIRNAAVEALRAGQTFYANSAGTAPLREAIKAYLDGLYGTDLDISRIISPGSTMLAVNMTVQSCLSRGDNAVVVSPHWPNIDRCLGVTGAEVRYVRQHAEGGKWGLDIDKVIDTFDEHTRLVYVNSPCNPTGWVMTTDEQRRLLDACRERNVMILADEVYHRLVYDADVAPSFLDIAGPDDPVVSINGFSKAWAMTGWRLGWMVVPESTTTAYAIMSQCTNTGSPTFTQNGGAVALRDGEALVVQLREAYRANRDLVLNMLGSHPRVNLLRPDGAFYAFPQISGLESSMQFAQELVKHEKVGLAPGYTFGEGNEQFLRMSFAISSARLEEALVRVTRFLDR